MEKDKKIRLVYFSVERFKDDRGDMRIGQSFGLSNPYIIPKGMSLEQVFKVISYLSEKIEREKQLESACPKSVRLTSEELSKYGFIKVDGYRSGYYNSTTYDYSRAIDLPTPMQFEFNKGISSIDLFSVGGDFELFKQTKLYSKYFEWFTSGITEEVVKDIYNQIGMNLDEILKHSQYNSLPEENTLSR